MNKINIEKVIQRSKGLKSYKKFNTESNKLSKLLDKFLQSKNLEYNKIFAEWLVIKLVIIWEYHFKSLIISLIDEGHYQFNEEIKLSLMDLEKIQKKKTISAGKIFVSTKRLQSIESVDKILSSLLGLSFVKELSRTYPKYIDLKTVNECLEKRHEIIHEMKKFTFTKQQIQKYATSMMLFQIQSAIFCDDKIKKIQVISKIPTVEIVDDEKEIVDVLREILEESNFNVVTTAFDGKTAVSEYNKFKPDIVLLDVKMPKFDGMYALEHIKEKNKDAKVLMFTGDITESTKRRALELDASAILYKPSNVDNLLKTIDVVLTKKQPMIIEKRQISKKLQEQMMQENVEVWIKNNSFP